MARELQVFDFLSIPFCERNVTIGPAWGTLEQSRCGWYLTPHYDVLPAFRRQGWCTLLVDIYYAIAAQNGLEICWVDEPHYKGIGWLSNDGQAFADAYRTRRGIALPPMYYVDYKRQLRNGRLKCISTT